jgi:hypothetical protein
MTISVAFDRLDASNWGRFRSEVAMMLRHSKTWKKAAAAAYLSLLGGVLSLIELVDLVG